jgi:hypothetical protein
VLGRAARSWDKTSDLVTVIHLGYFTVNGTQPDKIF